MHSLLFFALLPLLSSATLLTSPNPNNKHLLRRQSDCSVGESPCGEYCIKSGYFCCPDQQGGCRTSQYCTTGDDGTPCCCPQGKVCDGSCAVTFNTATVAASSPTSSSLAGSCASIGELPCGTGCMLAGDTCCPDGSGSCAAGQVCWLGTNGQYGCCPAGETCDGPGYAGNTATTSSYTSNYATYTSSSAVSDGFPSTYPDSPSYTSSSAVSDDFPSAYPDPPSFTTPSAATAAATTSAINGGVPGEATSWLAARSWIMNLLLPLFGTVFVIG